MRWEVPLNLEESARLYWELALRGGKSWGEKTDWDYGDLSEEKLLSLAVTQARYDPRLLEILIDFFCCDRFQGDPMLLKKLLKETNSLAVMAVIGEFVRELTSDQKILDLMDYLLAGVRPVSPQLFYPLLYRIAGGQMERAISQPAWAFKKWGFLAADPPLSKDLLNKKRIYLFDFATRQSLLAQVARTKERFRLRDYLAAVHHSVSRQQALKDLYAIPGVRRHRAGKGRYYTYNPKSWTRSG